MKPHMQKSHVTHREEADTKITTQKKILRLRRLQKVKLSACLDQAQHLESTDLFEFPWQVPLSVITHLKDQNQNPVL